MYVMWFDFLFNANRSVVTISDFLKFIMKIASPTMTNHMMAVVLFILLINII